MKYLILIYSKPEPWGHPTIDFTEVGRAIPDDERAAMHKEFEEMLAEISASGEFVTAEALGAPAASTIYRVGSKGRRVATDGPYAEAKEQLAGFFLIDVASRERAEELASRFAGPGDTVELRPVM
ncbi:YciI family protein [Kribbella sp. NBC_00889]|uniref:YciI family protein n=1 Tax=Kribbella sp. NBC_00889 TaxID=2975974 RepID=UPI003865FEA5|nr:YciI family protein [Kribbella sp. NBC_00889]